MYLNKMLSDRIKKVDLKNKINLDSSTFNKGITIYFSKTINEFRYHILLY